MTFGINRLTFKGDIINISARSNKTAKNKKEFNTAQTISREDCLNGDTYNDIKCLGKAGSKKLVSPVSSPDEYKNMTPEEKESQKIYLKYFYDCCGYRGASLGLLKLIEDGVSLPPGVTLPSEFWFDDADKDMEPRNEPRGLNVSDIECSPTLPSKS